MFAKCLGNWRNTAIYWLIIKVFCNLASCTILTFSQPRKMSFDVASFTILDYLNTAIYLHFRSIYVQINALKKGVVGGNLAWAICTNSMDLLHDLSCIIVHLVLKMDDFHKGALACSHGWKCIFLWNIQMWTWVSRAKMKIYIFDKIWNCCMSCSRPRWHMGHWKVHRL